MKMYQPDITEIEQIQDSFQKHIQEAIENYDEFLKKCLEQCGITQDYVLEHPEEFSKRENTQGDFCQYFRNGEEIFTILRHKEYEDMSHCTIKCIATFPNRT
jgi:hypothetical protein